MMSQRNESQTAWSGRHVSVAVRGNWEYATRNTDKPAVAIVAVTDDQRVILVEQYRPPVDRKVLELPAGLTGDLPGEENESLVEAARRELLEETGYIAHRWSELVMGCTSPGLTDELIALFLAQDLEKVGPGGGVENEAIEIHLVPLDGLLEWLVERALHIDLKTLAGLYAAERKLKNE
jgi:ADP-ribose pyrophosphatase